MKKTKTLYVTIGCQAYYNSSIEVPYEMDFDEAIEYAKKHLDEIPLEELEYVNSSDWLDEENCEFEEDE